jgi:hypothetical protein
MSVGGVPIAFNILSVHEDPLQGSPARLAAVSAELPEKGKVLFFVFKGTSLPTDFITNFGISPDYVPIHRAFDDSTTFVHSGAYHAISQLRVHHRENLFSLVRQAADEGIDRMVITGHSLGGQYALAFLLEVFCDTMAPASKAEAYSPLLKDARGVVFGTPMAFGSAEGTEVRKDMAEFFRTRTVNYINGGDPAPRLWSEIDLDGFLRVIAGQFREKLPLFLRPLANLEQRAEDFIQRQDIKAQMLGPAARYVHISTIRLIADGHRPWRPLGQENIVMDDHSARTGYIASFREALDPSSPKSLYSETGKALV